MRKNFWFMRLTFIVLTMLALACKQRLQGSKVAGAPDPRSFDSITQLEQLIQQQSRIVVPKGDDSRVLALTFDQFGQYFASAGTDGRVTLYRRGSAEAVASTQIEGEANLTAIDLLSRSSSEKPSDAYSLYIGVGAASGALYVGTLTDQDGLKFRKLKDAHAGSVTKVKWYDSSAAWNLNRSTFPVVSLIAAGIDGVISFNGWYPSENQKRFDWTVEPAVAHSSVNAAARAEDYTVKDSVPYAIRDLTVLSSGQVAALRDSNVEIWSAYKATNPELVLKTPVAQSKSLASARSTDKIFCRRAKAEDSSDLDVLVFNTGNAFHCQKQPWPDPKRNVKGQHVDPNDPNAAPVSVFEPEDTIFVGQAGGRMAALVYRQTPDLTIGSTARAGLSPSVPVINTAEFGWAMSNIETIFPTSAGKSLVVSDNVGHVVVYNVDEGNTQIEVYVPSGQSKGAYALAAPKIGGLVFASLVEGEKDFYLWDLGATYRPIKVSDTSTKQIDIADDGKTLVALGDDNALSAFDLMALTQNANPNLTIVSDNSGALPQIGDFRLFRDKRPCTEDFAVGRVEVSGSDPIHAVTANCDGSVDLWRIEVGGGKAVFGKLGQVKPALEAPRGCQAPVLDVSEDHRFLYVGTRDGRVEYFEVDLAAAKTTAVGATKSAAYGAVAKLASFTDNRCAIVPKIVVAMEPQETDGLARTFLITPQRGEETTFPVIEDAIHATPGKVSSLIVWHEMQTVLIASQGAPDPRTEVFAKLGKRADYPPLGQIVARFIGETNSNRKRPNLNNPDTREECLGLLGQSGVADPYVQKIEDSMNPGFKCDFDYPVVPNAFDTLAFVPRTRYREMSQDSMRFFATVDGASITGPSKNSSGFAAIFRLGGMRDMLGSLPPKALGFLPKQSIPRYPRMVSAFQRQNLIFAGGPGGVFLFWGGTEVGKPPGQ